MITPINLTSGFDNSAGKTSWVTASISPAADSLILLSFNVRNGISTNPTISSISGNGLTWVLVSSINQDNNSVSRLTTFVYRAMGNAPTTGTVTITTGENETGMGWSIDQFKGVNISGTNGSGSVIQSGTAAELIAPTVTSLTVTLNSFMTNDNVAFGAIGAGSNDVFVVGSGFIQLANNWDGTGGTDLATEWKRNDNTVDFSFNADFEVGMIALEILADKHVGFVTNKLRPRVFSPGLAR